MARRRRHLGKINLGGFCSFLLTIFLGTECHLKEPAMRKYVSTLFLAIGVFVFAISASEAKKILCYPCANDLALTSYIWACLVF